ncbi:hypothetical protein Hanom_Chr06g00521801 [Helianthus anomalus]
MDVFCTIGLSFSQIMPMVWRVLVVLDRIKNNRVPDLCVNNLPVVYRLRSHGSSCSCFTLLPTTLLSFRLPRMKKSGKPTEFRKLARPLPDSMERIETIYRLPKIERSFIPNQATSNQHSSSNMSEAPATTSSKPSAAPKPTPQPRARASGSKKRKGSDTASAATPESFSYEDLGFVDSFEPITTFLNKGLQHMLALYTESYEAVKVLEARLKRTEITISDQGQNHRGQDPVL